MAKKKKHGLSLRSGLPEDNGLAPAAAYIADSPSADVMVVVRLRCPDIVTHIDTGTKTAVMEIAEVEIMEGDREDAARRLLNDRRTERRSEEREAEERERAENGELTLDAVGEAEPGTPVEDVDLPSSDAPAFSGGPTGSRARKK